MVSQRRHPQQTEAKEVELLSVVKGGLVRQAVVHPLVQVIQYQHVRPRVLQQLHLVVNLKQVTAALLYVHCIQHCNV